MQFTEKDRAIMAAQEIILDGLAAYLGSGFELVLHTLETPEHSIVKIINSFHSGRSLGEPLNAVVWETIEEIQNSPAREKYKSYFTHSKSGVLLKSVSLPIFGSADRIIGLICINFYTNTPVSKLLELFAPQGVDSDPVHKETFGYNVEEVIASEVFQTREKVFADDTIASVNKNKEILNLLKEKGIFKLKNAVPLVASALGISKNTVYLHLRSLSKK